MAPRTRSILTSPGGSPIAVAEITTSVADRDGHGLKARRHIRLAENAFDVAVDRPLVNAQPVGGPAIVQARGRGAQHVALPSREAPQGTSSFLLPDLAEDGVLEHLGRVHQRRAGCGASDRRRIMG